MIRGRVCLAHAEHPCPVPIHDHHVRPQARGGRGTATVQLCANAHGMVHCLLDDLEDAAVTSPYATVREVVRSLPAAQWAKYPGEIRVIAYRGWLQYGLAFLQHRYDQHYRLWRSDGSPRHAGTPMFTDLGHATGWSRKLRRELLEHP